MLAIEVPIWMCCHGAAHQLRRGQRIVVHLGGEDGVEPRRLGLPGDVPDVAGPPPGAGDDR
jgi:hypothetical protein